MERQYVGIDLHRRRSVIVRMSEDGEKLSTVEIANDPIALSLAIAEAGPDPEVVLEATYGWYWAVDVLRAEGARVHLAHPQGLNWTQRRVKNDELTPPSWPIGCGARICPKRGSPRPRCGSCVSWCATGPYADIGIGLVMTRIGLCRGSGGAPSPGR